MQVSDFVLKRAFNESTVLQRWCCCLAVFWTGCLTILEMAVDDRRCPQYLFHFGAISVDFIMWSLCFTKLIELSLGFLSGDHAFTNSFNEAVSLGIIVMRSWWKVGCRQGTPIRHWSLQRSWLPLLWDQWEGQGVGSCFLFHLAWEHINL